MSNRSGGYNNHVSSSYGQPEIQIIQLQKSTNGMGLSIVAAKVRNLFILNIYPTTKNELLFGSKHL